MPPLALPCIHEPAFLTRDNPSLSRLTAPDLLTVEPDAEQLSAAVRAYLKGTISENTQRAYRSDLKQFIDWARRDGFVQHRAVHPL